MSLAGSKTVILVDGENLIFRYQDMLKNGSVSKNNVIHEQDVYVWNPDLIRPIEDQITDILRVAYYTSTPGAEEHILSLRQALGEIEYRFIAGMTGGGGGGGKFGDGSHSHQKTGTINPRIFHKKSQGMKSRQVDIAIALDALNYSLLDNIEEIQFYSGDSDFIPVINEVMRRGKKVTVKSFSSGTKEQLTVIPDEYECLDGYFFTNKD